MAIRRYESAVDVVTAARQRIRNAFETGANVNLNFSSGKDSLCMSHLTYELCRNGEVDRKRLKVIFIDEEGIYPSMVEAAERWRKKFMSIGVPFLWFCLPFKQVSVIDSLSQGESWITWDPNARDRWMREPLLSKLGGKVPVVIVDHHGDESADVYGTITHNRARGTHLLEPMKAIVKKLLAEGKSVQEIGKELGMRPEEIFRLSGFTRDEFLDLMTEDHASYSRAVIYKKM